MSVTVRTKGSGEVTYYVYGLGLIGEESAGNYFSYHFDYRGSTVALTNAVGQVVDRIAYSAYGELLTQPTHDTPFLFNGMYGVMSDDNGLYYMRARFYSPEIKRFVNQDVLLGSIADGQSLNRFAYVTGNPVSFVDPFGLEGISGNCAANPDDGYSCLLYDLNNQDMREFGEQLLGIIPGDVGKRIAEIARKYKGSSYWSYNNAVGIWCRFKPGTNKCNRFVYDILTEAGISVPTIRGKFNHCPPTASDWADSTVEIEGWEIVVGLPQPGDVVAVQHEYIDATGHVGIVSGENSTVSQSANTDRVEENDWGFRGNEGDVVFRRCTCLNP